MVVISVKQGQLKGVRKKSVLSGKEYCSFLGIPYAKPPVGLLRFQDPKPADNWTGIRDASKEQNVCLQMDLLVTQQIIGSEDCLYLNVHVPEILSEVKRLKAVIVYIHGGAFHFGSGSVSTYAPDYIMEHDVILVSINYRLHILGFLSLGLPDCTGNMGLKDQLLALQWLKDNIKSFGGDPENITLMGQSCGATSVHYLSITPLTKDKGLFKQTIMSSGHALSLSSLSETPLQPAYEFANILGYSGRDKRKLLKFLKAMPAIKLVETIIKMKQENQKNYPQAIIHFAFLPSVEEIKSETAFFPEHPQKLLQQYEQMIPTIYGFNDLEGLLSFDADAISRHLHIFQTEMELIISHNLQLKKESDATEIKEKILDAYPLRGHITNDDLPLFLKFYSDWISLKDLNTVFSSIIRSNSPLYQYLFAYEGKRNIHKMTLDLPFPIKGASHGDELGYFFSVSWLSAQEYTDDDLKIIRTLTKLWTNFAKTGNPNSEDTDIHWNPINSGKVTYLHIDKNIEIKDGLVQERERNFWEQIIKHYVRVHN